ncbi:MAG: methyltransferase [Treponema sp.]|nr:methyltransferase [Treponema sp.]
MSGSIAKAAVEAYGNKNVRFKFRGLDFEFALSQGLFSSADIDTGSRLLLKALSQKWDEDARKGLSPPVAVLDSGSGVGTLGICVARALNAVPDLRVRAQDRDELARCFTEYNAAQNGIGSAVLSAHTEPLLDGPAPPWDLIISNIPAKTGEPVLLDFVSRSAGLLSGRGYVMAVVVNTLAGLFRDRIKRLELPLFHDETGREHTVLSYGPKIDPRIGNLDRKNINDDFLERWPAYFRGAGNYELEDTGYHIDAIHGAAGFDRSGAAVAAMARLVVHIGAPLAGRCASKPILVHEPDQGHFPAWLLKHLEKTGATPNRVVLSGRNILALEAARHNLQNAAALVPAVDLLLGKEALSTTAPYAAVFLFPALVSQARRIEAYWEGLGALLETGGMALAALPSSEAERFDRAKPRGFIRLGTYKRHGFRALGFRKP